MKQNGFWMDLKLLFKTRNSTFDIIPLILSYRISVSHQQSLASKIQILPSSS